MAANAMHLGNTPEANEAYTPRDIAEASRVTLGGTIDLDPASCALANEQVVKAVAYYSLGNGQSGLTARWHGRVFCNPPGGKTGNESNAKLWWERGVAEWMLGRVEAMIWIAFKLDFLQVTQNNHGPDGPTWPMPLDFPICYPRQRLAYLTSVLPGPTAKNPDRKPTAKQIADHAAMGLCTAMSPPHASAIILLPRRDYFAHVHEFRAAFADIGTVVFDFDRLPFRKVTK